MECTTLVDRLIEHEQLMARLYREMAVRFPGRRQLLEGLALEEETHAGMLMSMKEAFFSTGLLTKHDIDVTMTQLEKQVSSIQEVLVTLARGALDEKELIDTILELEVSSTELQVNRIAAEHRDDPWLKVLVEILDNEEAHNQVLEEWKSDTE